MINQNLESNSWNCFDHIMDEEIEYEKSVKEFKTQVYTEVFNKMEDSNLRNCQLYRYSENTYDNEVDKRKLNTIQESFIENRSMEDKIKDEELFKCSRLSYPNYFDEALRRYRNKWSENKTKQAKDRLERYTEIENSDFEEYLKAELLSSDWPQVHKNFNISKAANKLYNTKSSEQITGDNLLEINEQDYLAPCLKAFNNYNKLIKHDISVKVYLKYLRKLQNVLGYKEDCRLSFTGWFDFSEHKEGYDYTKKLRSKEWYDYVKQHNVYNDQSLSYYHGINPYKLFQNKNISENVAYWGEILIYESLMQSRIVRFKREGCADKLIYSVKAIYNTRTNDEIEEDKLTAVTKTDYLNWCLNVWQDIENERIHREENEQFSLEQEYFKSQKYDQDDNYSQYGGPSDGYGGSLDDDFINGALGGEPDANWNLD